MSDKEEKMPTAASASSSSASASNSASAAAAAVTPSTALAAAAQATDTDKGVCEFTPIIRPTLVTDVNARRPLPLQHGSYVAGDTGAPVPLVITDDAKIHQSVMSHERFSLGGSVTIHPDVRNPLFEWMKHRYAAHPPRFNARMICPYIEGYEQCPYNAQTYWQDCLWKESSGFDGLQGVFGKRYNSAYPLVSGKAHNEIVTAGYPHYEKTLYSLQAAIADYVFMVVLQCWTHVNRCWMKCVDDDPLKPPYILVLHSSDFDAKCPFPDDSQMEDHLKWKNRTGNDLVMAAGELNFYQFMKLVTIRLQMPWWDEKGYGDAWHRTFASVLAAKRFVPVNVDPSKSAPTVAATGLESTATAVAVRAAAAGDDSAWGRCYQYLLPALIDHFGPVGNDMKTTAKKAGRKTHERNTLSETMKMKEVRRSVVPAVNAIATRVFAIEGDNLTRPPMLFTHLYFRPDQPVFQFIPGCDRDECTRWQLFRYMNVDTLLEFDKKYRPDANTSAGDGAVKKDRGNSTCSISAEREPLNHSRFSGPEARYSCFRVKGALYLSHYSVICDTARVDFEQLCPVQKPVKPKKTTARKSPAKASEAASSTSAAAAPAITAKQSPPKPLDRNQRKGKSDAKKKLDEHVEVTRKDAKRKRKREGKSESDEEINDDDDEDYRVENEDAEEDDVEDADVYADEEDADEDQDSKYDLDAADLEGFEEELNRKNSKRQKKNNGKPTKTKRSPADSSKNTKPAEDDIKSLHDSLKISQLPSVLHPRFITPNRLERVYTSIGFDNLLPPARWREMLKKFPPKMSTWDLYWSLHKDHKLSESQIWWVMYCACHNDPTESTNPLFEKNEVIAFMTQAIKEWDDALDSLDGDKDRALQYLAPYVQESSLKRREELIRNMQTTAKAFGVSNVCDKLTPEMQAINRNFDDMWFQPSIIQELLAGLGLTIRRKSNRLAISALDFRTVVNCIRASAADRTPVEGLLNAALNVATKQRGLSDYELWSESDSKRYAEGAVICKSVIGIWMQQIKIPIFHHIIHRVHPLYGPLLPDSGTQWVSSHVVRKGVSTHSIFPLEELKRKMIGPLCTAAKKATHYKQLVALGPGTITSPMEALVVMAVVENLRSQHNHTREQLNVISNLIPAFNQAVRVWFDSFKQTPLLDSGNKDSASLMLKAGDEAHRSGNWSLLPPDPDRDIYYAMMRSLKGEGVSITSQDLKQPTALVSGSAASTASAASSSSASSSAAAVTAATASPAGKYFTPPTRNDAMLGNKILSVINNLSRLFESPSATAALPAAINGESSFAALLRAEMPPPNSAGKNTNRLRDYIRTVLYCKRSLTVTDVNEMFTIWTEKRGHLMTKPKLIASAIAGEIQAVIVKEPTRSVVTTDPTKVNAVDPSETGGMMVMVISIIELFGVSTARKPSRAVKTSATMMLPMNPPPPPPIPPPAASAAASSSSSAASSQPTRGVSNLPQPPDLPTAGPTVQHLTTTLLRMHPGNAAAAAAATASAASSSAAAAPQSNGFPQQVLLDYEIAKPVSRTSWFTYEVCMEWMRISKLEYTPYAFEPMYEIRPAIIEKESACAESSDASSMLPTLPLSQPSPYIGSGGGFDFTDASALGRMDTPLNQLGGRTPSRNPPSSAPTDFSTEMDLASSQPIPHPPTAVVAAAAAAVHSAQLASSSSSTSAATNDS